MRKRLLRESEGSLRSNVGIVKLDIEGNIALITISAPEVRNGLSAEMGDQIVAICETIDGDEHIGAAIVKGDGGMFCSGADTRTWTGMSDPASPEAFSQISSIYNALVRVGELKVPSIAGIRGAAVGAGMNLCMATDIRIVSHQAKLAAGFLRIGIHPGGGFFSLVGRSAGREAAAALGLFGEEISGERAVQLGMAWESLPDELVESRAFDIATIASRDPELVRHAVANFRAELGPPPVSWRAAVEMERGIQMWSQRRRHFKIDGGNT
jgi:enoyl-CoA hydratase